MNILDYFTAIGIVTVFVAAFFMVVNIFKIELLMPNWWRNRWKVKVGKVYVRANNRGNPYLSNDDIYIVTSVKGKWLQYATVKCLSNEHLSDIRHTWDLDSFAAFMYEYKFPVDFEYEVQPD